MLDLIIKNGECYINGNLEKKMLEYLIIKLFKLAT